jgi:hypothetical protein
MAQEAVAQLRARGIPIEIRGNWLVYELEGTEREAIPRMLQILDRVWPGWRDCVSE